MKVDFRTLNTTLTSSNDLNGDIDKYQIALEDLEFAFSLRELNYIQENHNNGVWITVIAENIRRNEYEVMIAILHMLRRGRKILPLNL